MPKSKDRDRDGIAMHRGRYRVSFTDAQGRRCRISTSAQTLTQARAIRAAKMAEVEKELVLGYRPPSRDTFAEFAPRYLQHQQARLTPLAYERTRGVVETHLRRVFGALRLAEIRTADVERYITARTRAKTSAHSVTKEVNVLKHLFTVAVQQELVATNPAHGVRTPRVPAGRLRYLQPTELHAVLKACPVWLRPIAALLAFTGMRRGELLGLRWLDVDHAGGRIMLPQTKNGTGRVVWLSEMARTVLNSLPRGRATELVFPPSKQVSPANVSLTLLRTCRRLGIADFRLHDLRHTAASWLMMTGADIYTVAQLLGHKDVRMTARYAHLSPVHLQTAVRGLDRAFAGALPLEPSGADRGPIEPPNLYKPALTGTNAISA
jgi:integrase